jgi:hypothetical protein
VGPEIETFLALKWERAQRVPFGPKKVEISGPTPSNVPRNGFPHPNPYVQSHINNRYIGNFMDKRPERDKKFQGPFRDGLY